MNIEIRKELPSENYEVENLVREAFWNVYRPGCAEHLILHHFRQHPNYLEVLLLFCQTFKSRAWENNWLRKLSDKRERKEFLIL